MSASLLKLNRFQVIAKGKMAYDQVFHEGVNIIAGSNGSGKSTIADLIFYGLGGDLLKWKEHALFCDYVLAEILTNNGILTLKREISHSSQQAMSIFYGTIEDAHKNGDAWEKYNYSRSKNNQSFSQILFKALGIPEAISEETSNITMNQILRLMYVDQMSSIQRIFRDDVTRDTPLVRQAVSDLMCGIGGYDLYEKELRLRATRKIFDNVKVELSNLITVASGYGKSIRGEQIYSEMSSIRHALEAKNQELKSFMEEFHQDNTAYQDGEADRRKALGELKKLKHKLQEAEEQLITLNIEIEDTKQFMDFLRENITAFDNASYIFEKIGQIKFEYCPSCLSPVNHQPQLSHHCSLCHQEVKEGHSKEKEFAVRIDLTQQLQESSRLLEKRLSKHGELKREINQMRREHKKLTNLYTALTIESYSDRDSKIASLNRHIGALENSLEIFHQRLELANRIDDLATQKAELQDIINNLMTEIEIINSQRQKRESKVKTEISHFAGEFLKGDLEEQNDFLQELDYVAFDFADDWMAINGERNVSKSASGMVILKNSLYMGLFISAVRDALYNYPRFILMDNIEDKGMVTERSQNFQRLICEASDSLNKSHQIIFTTSMLNPALDTEEYIIGRKYDKEHKTLIVES